MFLPLPISSRKKSLNLHLWSRSSYFSLNINRKEYHLPAGKKYPSPPSLSMELFHLPTRKDAHLPNLPERWNLFSISQYGGISLSSMSQHMILLPYLPVRRNLVIPISQNGSDTVTPLSSIEESTYPSPKWEKSYPHFQAGRSLISTIFQQRGVTINPIFQ